MTTVMEGMQVSSFEPESEDGLTSQQRKVLYEMILKGVVVASTGDLHDYELTTALGLNPAICGEIGQSMAGLVELGFVSKTEKVHEQDTTNVYGPGWSGVAAVSADTVIYRPVLEARGDQFSVLVAIRRPVPAWLYVYGVLEFPEHRSDDGQTLYKSKIAEVMGQPESREADLLADVAAIGDSDLAEKTLTRGPGKWGGSYEKTYDITETRVRLALI